MILELDLTPETRKVLLTVEETAELIGISRAKAYTMTASGELPSVKVGKNRRVVYTDLVAWAEGLQRQPTSQRAVQ